MLSQKDFQTKRDYMCNLKLLHTNITLPTGTADFEQVNTG